MFKERKGLIITTPDLSGTQPKPWLEDSFILPPRASLLHSSVLLGISPLIAPRTLPHQPCAAPSHMLLALPEPSQNCLIHILFLQPVCKPSALCSVGREPSKHFCPSCKTLVAHSARQLYTVTT